METIYKTKADLAEGHQAGGFFRTRIFFAIVFRPLIWGTAILQGLRLLRFRKGHASLKKYMRFRSETSHGDPEHRPKSKHVLEWLYWCKNQRKLKINQIS